MTLLSAVTLPRLRRFSTPRQATGFVPGPRKAMGSLLRDDDFLRGEGLQFRQRRPRFGVRLEADPNTMDRSFVVLDPIDVRTRETSVDELRGERLGALGV